MFQIELDFERNKLELFQDWTENDTKTAFISELEKRAEHEKESCPVLLSRGDLKQRWYMDSRQSVHNVTKRMTFPAPFLKFSDGKVPLYLESEVAMFEIKYPWILTQESRLQYSHWVLKNVINNPKNPNNVENQM